MGGDTSSQYLFPSGRTLKDPGHLPLFLFFRFPWNLQSLRTTEGLSKCVMVKVTNLVLKLCEQEPETLKKNSEGTESIDDGVYKGQEWLSTKPSQKHPQGLKRWGDSPRKSFAGSSMPELCPSCAPAEAARFVYVELEKEAFLFWMKPCCQPGTECSAELTLRNCLSVNCGCSLRWSRRSYHWFMPWHFYCTMPFFNTLSGFSILCMKQASLEILKILGKVWTHGVKNSIRRHEWPA